jgi:hypothetical protein
MTVGALYQCQPQAQAEQAQPSESRCRDRAGQSGLEVDGASLPWEAELHH